MEPIRLFSATSLFCFSILLLAACYTPASIRTDDQGDYEDHGYTRVKKGSSTSHVSSYDRQGINDNPTLTLTDMISRLPGVQVSGQGPNATVLIRGISSINGNNEPLFVVDGINLGFGFNKVAFMNPIEIDRISVLKDPSDTAMYGVQGANGVILIKTKGTH